MVPRTQASSRTRTEQNVAHVYLSICLPRGNHSYPVPARQSMVINQLTRPGNPGLAFLGLCGLID